jgi:negative regulator of flagellin synthesis FlgM
MATNRIGNRPPQNTAAAFVKSDETKKASDASGVVAAVSPETVAKANVSRTDQVGVTISKEAKARSEAQQKALEIARGTPDVREDRVKALKAQIDAGTYQVDSGKIADGMLREAIREHLAETPDR